MESIWSPYGVHITSNNARRNPFPSFRYHSFAVIRKVDIETIWTPYGLHMDSISPQTLLGETSFLPPAVIPSAVILKVDIESIWSPYESIWSPYFTLLEKPTVHFCKLD